MALEQEHSSFQCGVILREESGHGDGFIRGEIVVFDKNIRDNTGFLKIFFSGCEVSSGGQAEGSLGMRQRQDGLDEGFADGIFSNDDGAMMILEGGGENFGGAGGIFIDEQGERELIRGKKVSIGAILGDFVGGMDTDDEAAVEKEADGIDSGAHNASPVGAQIDNQGPGAAVSKLIEGAA